MIAGGVDNLNDDRARGWTSLLLFSMKIFPPITIRTGGHSSAPVLVYSNKKLVIRKQRKGELCVGHAMRKNKETKTRKRRRSLLCESSQSTEPLPPGFCFLNVSASGLGYIRGAGGCSPGLADCPWATAVGCWASSDLWIVAWGSLSRSSQASTTSSTVGRSVGQGCQHFRRRLCIWAVSPTSSEFCGNSGLFPRDTRRAAIAGRCPLNGGSPANTSKASIEKANMSAGLYSTTGVFVMWMSSGASGPSTAHEVAAAVKLGLRFMGPNPYSVKRALPDPSI